MLSVQVMANDVAVGFGGVLGLDFLINYVFYRAPSKRP